MTPDSLAPTIVVGALVVIIAVIGVRFAGRLGVPGLLIYLLIGLALGTVFPIGLDDPQLGIVLGYAALIIILAHGGLTTRWQDLRPVLWPSVVLATVGVGVSVIVVALPLIWLAGLEPRVALVLAAVLSATDAAAVFSVLRKVNVLPRLRSLLEGESGFNDAPVVVLVTLLAASALPADPWEIPLLVVAELVGGAVVGIALGFAARWLMPRIALPSAGLYPIAVITVLVACYGVADLLHASGFLAVYVAAVIVGSSKSLPHRRAVKGFSDGLSWAAEIGLFVMLGLLVDPSRLPQALGMAVLAAVVLVLLARPAAAVVSLVPFRWPVRAIAFVSVAGLRGAVPIVFAAIPLGVGMPGGELIFDATFIVVLILTVLQTPALPWLSRRLGVAVPSQPGEIDVDSAPLDEARALVLSIEVPDDSKLAGVFVTELGLPVGAVASLVIRGGDPIVPDAETRIRTGDRLLVVTTDSAREGTERRLRALSLHGRLAGWRGAGED
ncbi:MAG: potassium/proton antiporter [Candidatus Nanopelagicales bacterium]